MNYNTICGEAVEFLKVLTSENNRNNTTETVENRGNKGQGILGQKQVTSLPDLLPD